MRRKFLIAAFLGTTALTPEPAEAAAVGGFIVGALGGAAAAGASAAFVAGVSVGAAFAATAIGGFIVKTVVAVGLSALAGALAPKPSLPPPAARMVNFAQPVTYAEYVFGRARKGGPLGFRGFADNRRYYVPILAAHEIEGIVEHWLDERPVALTAEAEQGVSNISTAPIAGHGRINVFTGAAGQVVDPGLEAAFAEITTAHDFKGLAGAVLWAKRPPQESFSKIYPNGKQWSYAPVLDGKKDLYDPRTGSRGYSNNAALVMADWVVNILGRGVDWDEVADEANACDLLVTNAERETQPLWTLNGTISDEQSYEDQRAQLAAACDAFIYERTDGKVGFTFGRWIEPTLTLTADDFFAVELSEGKWGADAPDEVAAVYVEPTNGWRETPSGTWVENDVAKPVRDEPQLYMVHNHNQAARMNKRIARTRRAKYQLNGTIGMAGYEILGGRDGGRSHRFIRVVHDDLGVDDYFEVGELVREGVATFTLSANSVRPEDFDFDAETEEPQRPRYGAVVSDSDIPVPENLTGAPQDNGSALFVWDPQDSAYTQELRYRPVGDSYWLTQQTSESTDRLRVGGLADGQDYEAQIRNRTAGVGASDWGPETPVVLSAVADTVPPGGLSAFSVSEAAGNAVISFTAPNDSHYFGTRIYRGWDGSFDNAVLIHTEYGISSSGDSYTDPAPGYATFYYWAEPINSSELPGPRSGPQTITINEPGP
ncbi:fibronectin type III domain-containing protein [Leisingera caerulea]|uniref:Fibronectin type III domain-containing protein n=1 Tax=Leisingera caerulea TaxID=506591 RepID=A0ABY5X041_LEICA|nr:fibronectin type III domain-containing protein [Leisingera caerulea]UWQ59971.1 fibronectin type III domain-containing protein [Leisingera caerulea]